MDLGKVMFSNFDRFSEFFSFFFESYPAKSEIKTSIERNSISFLL